MLQGLRVLTTRPEPQAERLLQPLRAAGVQVQNLPLLEIEPQPLDAAARHLLLNLDQYHKVVVVSPTAARLLIEAVEDYWPQWPLGVDYFTVGKGSADSLQTAGQEARYPQQGDTSEDLLQLSELQQLAQQKVLLVKGEGGRNLLQQTLQQRGAQVDLLLLYRRVCPVLNATQQALLQSGGHQVVVLTSGDALQHYHQLLPKDHAHPLLLVPSQRLVATARQLGFKQVLNSGGAGAEAIIATLHSARALIQGAGQAE